ncbi:MAG: tRNA 2-thiouridine(34) synthase MnmA [Thermodesulfobacteriota bacterium]
MRPVTAVAISGGVDSLIAAYLLQQQGHRVIGVHFVNGYEEGLHPPAAGMAPNDWSSLRKQGKGMEAIASRLGIELRIIDCRQPFQKEVIDYFIATYRNGKTPNPCLVCNPLIKFGVLLNAAKTFGAERLATGHYARLWQAPDSGLRLLTGIDSRKDQSYFLAFLRPSQLAEASFPLGEMEKKDVRAMAEKTGLSPLTRLESQDVCFLAGQPYSVFLEKAGLPFRPGEIVDQAGNILGWHNGLHLFTVGQRKGINCPAGHAYYVLKLDTAANRLVVGRREELFSRQCLVEQINWIVTPPALEFTAKTRIRYRHTAAPSTVSLHPDGSATVCFHQPQSAVTPGQGAVFYQDDEVLGGGWIV